MTRVCLRDSVRSSLERTGLVAVVRATDFETARRQSQHYLATAVELIEVTFTVPEAPALVLELFRARGKSGPPWIGMGTVTNRDRAEQAVSVGAEFVVTPNVAPEVAALTKLHELFLIMGALTPTELVTAHQLGADVLKVYPLPPVGGPTYLATLRQPLGDLAPMLAAGGFEIEEIPAYRKAGAMAFGLGASQLVGKTPFETTQNVNRALGLARAPSEVWNPA